MSTNNRKDTAFPGSFVLLQFWEAWVLALVLVTILVFFGKSHQPQLITQSDYNRSQFDPLQVQSTAPGEQGRPLESGF